MFKSAAISLGIAVFTTFFVNARADDTKSSKSVSADIKTDQVVTNSPTGREGDSSSRTYSTNSDASTHDADNTGRNTRDRSNDTLTSGDQANDKSDVELTRRIRRALTSNDQFSTTAKNIKIITRNGKVTLRGPVKSAEEQQAIGSAAKQIAGDSSVDNQLEVKATNQ